ncbi:LysR family transcriptional regulator [Limosilactobacillus sp. STM2_1]|uniref:LysR family transcriptional regulator n=1 Tax=Limosilactobacillus rudii TaxID=2759755 RepID=A0A7W3UKQ4_9LACO|nr:LysR family transcriptional regulator [Limosilactobacillus rudii]MBB1079210.1 LysR family transcriptional regulator [Limosilactobacillus rudii]MBB1097299.1 LysR family transcriptional regulator [Limosilactobacillus rudii]MCD7134408.1 LysR family transcriptional regulator [Limosilactobacillus rudii]
MIDNYLLEELVTFAETKTLAKTAEKLMITQPTVTRGMQKLEDELGVKLFDRQPNKISLTKAGKLAAKKAQLVLDTNRQFVTDIRNYAYTQKVIKIASIAPGPQIVINDNKASLTANIDLNQKLFDINQVEPALLNHQYSLIITNREIQTDHIESRYLGQEQLYVNLDQFMYLANQQQVTFKELTGLSFVVLNEIGPWKQIIQDNIPNAKFLYQTEYDSMQELTKYTNFPFFTTNITNPSETYDTNDTVKISITNDAATMTFYAAYLKSQRNIVAPLAKKLVNVWPK